MSKTLIERLDFLQSELYEITKEVNLLQSSSKLQLKFVYGQEVYLVKGNKTYSGLISMISSEETKLEDLIEKTTINKIIIEQTNYQVPEGVTYIVNRYYEYKNSFKGEELWYSYKEAEEALSKEFNQAKIDWRENIERQKKNRQEQLERELNKLKETK